MRVRRHPVSFQAHVYMYFTGYSQFIAVLYAMATFYMLSMLCALSVLFVGI
jgi:hypothetical protein